MQIPSCENSEPVPASDFTLTNCSSISARVCFAGVGVGDAPAALATGGAGGVGASDGGGEKVGVVVDCDAGDDAGVTVSDI